MAIAHGGSTAASNFYASSSGSFTADWKVLRTGSNAGWSGNMDLE